MRTTKLLIFSLLLSFISQLNAQSVKYEETIGKKAGTLSIHYFENTPTAYKEGETVKGIEIDILNQFSKWIQENKGIAVNFNYQSFTDFDEMYKSVQTGNGNTVGVGTVTITDNRSQEVDFSAPYMKNVSILVTAGEVKTVRSDKELKEFLGSMQAVTVKGSIHEEHLRHMYSIYSVPAKITYVKDPMDLFKKLKDSPRNFGYVDVITFWKYLKEDNKHFVKMHSYANYKDENFGFIFPKNSGWANEFNEFFESGFGFTSTKEYRKILENHLSYEILNSVELNP